MLKAPALKEYGDCPSCQRGHQPHAKSSRPCKARELNQPRNADAAAVSSQLRARVGRCTNASPGWHQQPPHAASSLNHSRQIHELTLCSTTVQQAACFQRCVLRLMTHVPTLGAKRVPANACRSVPPSGAELSVLSISHPFDHPHFEGGVIGRMQTISCDAA